MGKDTMVQPNYEKDLKERKRVAQNLKNEKDDKGKTKKVYMSIKKETDKDKQERLYEIQQQIIFNRKKKAMMRGKG